MTEIMNNGGTPADLKITFEDKIDSWALSAQRDFMLTAGDINEIKRVVNSISDEIQGADNFSGIYRNARFVLPSVIPGDESIDFELQMSSDPLFQDEASTASMKVSDDLSKVEKFENGAWRSVNSLFTSADAGASIKVDIMELLEHRLAPYFGRYRFMNEDDSFTTEWKGFALGAFDNSDTVIEDKSVCGCYITGPSFVVEKTRGVFSVTGVCRDGSTVDLTRSATFAVIGDSLAAVTENNVDFGKSHVDHVVLVKATVASGSGFTAAIPVLVKAVTLDKLDVTFLNGNQEIIGDTSVTFKADAIYSDGTVVRNVEEACAVTLDMASGSVNSGVVTCSSDKDEIGVLTVRYVDQDFSEGLVESATSVKYIRYLANTIESISASVSADTIVYDDVQGSAQIAVSVSATKRDGRQAQLSPADATITLANGDGFTLAADASAWTLTAAKADLASNKTVSLLVTANGTDKKCVAQVAVAGRTLADASIAFKNGADMVTAAFAGATLTYSVTDIFSDSSRAEAESCEVVAMTDNCIVDEATKTVLVDQSAENGVAILKFRTAYRGKTIERIASFKVVSNKPFGLAVTGDFAVDFTSSSPIEKTYAVSLLKKGLDGSVIQEAASGASLKLILGKPAYVAVDGQTVAYSLVDEAQETYTFEATVDGLPDLRKVFTVVATRSI